MTEALKLGINGFGRIGRSITRIAANDDRFEIAAVNDISDATNLIYLYNYDSTYGRANPPAELDESKQLASFGDDPARFFSARRITDVPWADFGVDVLVDASGVHENLLGARELVDAGLVRKVIVTNSPPSGVDRYVIMGVNDSDYDTETDHIISNTICDANAIAHVLKALDSKFGVETGFITTLHPWLSYQNVVDGPVGFQRFPGAYWDEYSLGRSCVSAMIPKRTTAVTALRPILPAVEDRLTGFSFRTPTSIVSIADLSLGLGQDTTVEEVVDFIGERFAGSPYVKLNREPLVSTDYVGDTASAVIDMRWIQMSGTRMVKLVLWYDNEWGYSSRVLDLARLLDPRTA